MGKEAYSQHQFLLVTFKSPQSPRVGAWESSSTNGKIGAAAGELQSSFVLQKLKKFVG